MTDIFSLLIDREPSLSPKGAPFPFRPPLATILMVIGRILVTLIAPGTGRRMARSAAEEYIHRLEQGVANLNGVEARYTFFREQASQMLPTVFKYLIPLVVPAMASRFLAEAKVRDWLGDTAGFQPLLRSLPYNPTTEMDLALWRVSQKLKDEGNLPTASAPAVKEFLAAYGHRGVREIDIGMPRWQDDPTPILEILTGYLSHQEDSDPEARFQRGADEAQRAAADLVSQVRKKKGPLHALILRFLISRMRALLGTRELPKFLAVKAFAVYRKVALGAGTDLAAAGRLERAEDVVFLDLDDWTSNKDLQVLAAQNRAQYQREINRRAVPRVVTSTGEVFFHGPESQEGALVGTPASAGVYEGKVRVIFDPRGAQLAPGEVLVAPGTDPAWTPLFLTAGALVMEIGGIMSHGSVVAREYGIPAVVGVPGATEKLSTGQRVRVDGESGLVLPLD